MTDDAIETTDTSRTVRRTFEPPRERVCRAFVDPDELAQWYALGETTMSKIQSHTERGTQTTPSGSSTTGEE